MKYTKIPSKQFDELVESKLELGDIKVIERGQPHYSIFKKYGERVLVNEVPRDRSHLKKVDAIILDEMYIRDGGFISKRVK